MRHHSAMTLETLNNFLAPRQTLSERLANGKSVRQQTPRRLLGPYEVRTGRLDPINILQQQAKFRIKDLIPIRHARMSADPFAFFRGAAAIMARDLATHPSPDIQVQLCGDMHVSNFGFFSTTERRLVFGINDFDETLPGNFDWDLKRLTTSTMIAAQHLGKDTAYGESAIRHMCEIYRRYLYIYANTPHIELARTYLDDQQILQKAALPGVSNAARKYVAKQIAKARTNVNQNVIGKITEKVGKDVRLINQPPMIEHLSVSEGGNSVQALFNEGLRSYAKNLVSDRRHTLELYRLVDYARKVVGVGSVGLTCWILFLEGLDHNDPLFLQVKGANRSVLAPFFSDRRFRTQGERVVYGQRLIQGAPDLFLGYGKTREVDFYVRQLRDMKGGITIGCGKGDIGAAEFYDYAALFGWALANAHARSGDPALLAGYCGKGTQLDDAMVQFATAYAEQNLADYEMFMKAIRDGELCCAENS
jgi:uncharacterized protein (DUF2252 family)